MFVDIYQRLYRDRIMAMRRGRYFFDRDIYREELANLYIGYQVCAHSPHREAPSHLGRWLCAL